MKLDILISQIQSVDGNLKQEANKAVNRLLTMRNWLIGYYIVEYEQKGEDKGKYGNNLMEVLSSALDIKGLSATNLRHNRAFYISYPQIRQTLSDEFMLKNNLNQIQQTVSAEFTLEKNANQKSQTVFDQFTLENNNNQFQQTPSAEMPCAGGPKNRGVQPQ